MKIPACITICRETFLLQLFFIEIWAGQPTFMVKWQTSVLWIKQLSKEITVVQKSSIISYFYDLHINETSFGTGKFPIYLTKKTCYPKPHCGYYSERLSNLVVISNLLKKPLAFVLTEKEVLKKLFHTKLLIYWCWSLHTAAEIILQHGHSYL